MRTGPVQTANDSAAPVAQSTQEPGNRSSSTDNWKRDAGQPGSTFEPAPDAEPATPRWHQAPTHTVSVQLIDASGAAVAGLTVGHIVEELGADRGANEDNAYVRRNGVSTSSSEGRLLLDNVPILAATLFVIEGSQWTVESFNGGEPAMEPPVNGWSLRPGVAAQTVTLSRSHSVTLIVRYEDGQPVTGRLGYSVWRKVSSDGQEKGFPREPLELVGQPEVVLDNMPPRGRLWGNVFCRRPGFRVTTVFKFLFESGGRQEIVVPRDEAPQCGLEIDFAELLPGESVHVLLLDEAGHKLHEFGQVGPGVLTTRNLAGYMQDVTVMAFGDRVWKSGPIHLDTQTGQWHRVTARLAKPGTVKLRAVDEQGNPVFPAVATYSSAMYVDWRNPRRYEKARVSAGMNHAHYASASRDGRIEYTGLPPGRYDFAVEAAGFLRATFQADVPEGGAADFGDVAVVRADADNTGVLRVRLEGIDAPETFRIELYQPRLGFQIRAPVQLQRDGTAEFTLLDLRPYAFVVLGSKPESPDNAKSWNGKASFAPGRHLIEVVIRKDTPQDRILGE